jgi:broad specificity phosphatase PhoE
MNRIYVARHGQSTWNAERRGSGILGGEWVR